MNHQSNIENLFGQDVLIDMRSAIKAAKGNEVFFHGSTDADRHVVGVEVLARGSKQSVPAIISKCRYGDVVIHNHPSGELSPSEADIDIAGILGSSGVGFAIVNNTVDDCYVVVEPFQQERMEKVLPEQISNVLGTDGLLSKGMNGYEERTEQLRMAFAVGDAFNMDKIAVIEAGTGTGKSLAYLTPALSWGLANKRRVLVSTQTINLQEQLIEKDLPQLQRATGWEFKAVLAKGRGNYLCKRRLSALVREPSLFPEESEHELMQLKEWADSSHDGSRSDLSFSPSIKVWDEVRSEADHCGRAKCKNFGDCFFYSARREASRADLLVVNHALLFTDIAIKQLGGGTGILPSYTRVVLDEAHHLEDAATNHFSIRVNPFTVKRRLQRLLHVKRREKGILPRLMSVLAQEIPRESGDDYEKFFELFEQASTLRVSCETEVDTVFQQLSSRVFGDAPQNFEKDLRITDDNAEELGWSEIVPPLNGLMERVQELIDLLNRLVGMGERQLLIRDSDNLRSAVLDIEASAGRFCQFIDEIAQFISRNESDCCWFTYQPARGKSASSISLCVAPVTIAETLQGSLFNRLPTVVLTSATLTISNSFRYFQRRVGLAEIERERITTLNLPSPFSYQEQARVLVPADLPEPERDGYWQGAGSLMTDAVQAAEGRTFILFTAYRTLSRFYDEIAPILTASGILCLRQGEMQRTMLLKRFVSAEKAVLFATDSFWEGVDVAGDDLSQIIMARLPFRVPTEPIQQARSEDVVRKGGDAFFDFSIPTAVIRFRQGFGRLIRSRTDRGTVLVLDSRIATKRYGKIFLNSLPDVGITIDRSETVSAEVQQFFGQTVLVEEHHA